MENFILELCLLQIFHYIAPKIKQQILCEQALSETQYG